MKHRVHEILLVASPYDAFILEEEGGLTEQIMTEYIGMNFNYAPRVTRASTSVSAMQYLSKNKFDLVIVMLRIEDTDPISLGKSIKKHYPRMPVILLAFDETEIKQLSQKISPSSINRVFIWSGDASVFPAIIKYVEDRKNAERDIIKGNVRAIILIEDSPRMYSVLLPLIYREIVSLTKSLMKKTFNSTYKSMHLRARIKVLLTPNYETALKFSKIYGENIVGVISDVKFLNKGKKDPKAGVKIEVAVCSEFAAAAANILKGKGVRVEICGSIEGHHNFVVVGRPQGSNIGDKSTWGNAAIVDCWMGAIWWMEGESYPDVVYVPTEHEFPIDAVAWDSDSQQAEASGGDAASDRPKGGIGNLLTSFKLRKTGIDTTK